eukprot:8003299-Pyramimonas_sp.AAC.1
MRDLVATQGEVAGAGAADHGGPLPIGNVIPWRGRRDNDGEGGPDRHIARRDARVAFAAGSVLMSRRSRCRLTGARTPRRPSPSSSSRWSPGPSCPA